MANQQETQALSQENLTPLNEEQLQNATGGGGCFGKLLPPPHIKNASDEIEKVVKERTKELVRNAQLKRKSQSCTASRTCEDCMQNTLRSEHYKELARR